jgi:isopentenyl diphosphate isomerase/L-lactate dehydrogenase-like FMN-dependent dehydrogenase
VEPLSVADYATLAEARLDPATWAYVVGGAEDEATLRENRAAFGRVRLVPRALRGVAAGDTRTTVLGAPVALPVLVAPMAAHGAIHPEAECATARGSAVAGTVMVVGSEATQSLEEVACAGHGPMWFQPYVYAADADRALLRDQVRRGAGRLPGNGADRGRSGVGTPRAGRAGRMGGPDRSGSGPTGRRCLGVRPGGPDLG